jgi:hypothetical protein
MTDSHEREYDVGYGKPPKHTRFGEPRGNKPGLTSEAAYALHEATEKTAKLYLEMISAIEGKIEDIKTDKEDPDKYAAMLAVKGDILRLMKDVMDRGHGTPKQSVDLSSEDGSMSPQKSATEMTDAELAEIIANRK